MNPIYKSNRANFAMFRMLGYTRVISLGFLLASSLLMYITFLIAYFNPSKSVNVYINRYGEATLEIWLMGILLLISLVMVLHIVKEEARKNAAT